MKFLLNNFVHLLKRFKMASALNILGLSAAFCVFIVVAIQTSYDFSYNRGIKNYQNIYQIGFLKKGQFGVANISQQLAQTIKDKVALDESGIDESVIGKGVNRFGSLGEIVGIVENINFESLHEPIKPMAFYIPLQQDWFRYMFIRISSNDMPATISYINDTWKKHSEEQVEVKFLDSALDNLYKKENVMSKLIGLFGLVAVAIAIMGIYGLILFNIRYKTKEIAVRKVNGASINSVILLLNKSLLALLAIAFAIAIPIALFMLSKWLESFAYKAAIPWWLFLFAGALILVITVAAVSWQSWNAATTNPIKALKNE